MITILQHHLNNGTGKKYQKIAEGIRKAISDGTLQPGDRLPPQRELADALHVTHGTVTRAYREIDRIGLVRGEVGRGTYVARQEDAEFTLHALHNRPGNTLDGCIRFDLNFPVQEGTPDLSEMLIEISRSPVMDELLLYQPTMGLPRHRQAACQWMEQMGMPADPDRTAITAGAQQALFAALGSALAPGDCLAADCHTYPGLLNLASVLHLKLIPVEADDAGMRPDALAKAAKNHRIKGVYLIPTLHNPTTVTMPDTRRQELAAVICRCDLFLLEDDVYGGMSLQPCTPIAARIPEQSFYLTGMSKTLAPGLRIGFLHIPQRRIRAVEQVMAASIWMNPLITMEIAGRWINNKTADRIITEKRGAIQQRGQVLTEVLNSHSLQYRTGSPHGWLHLPRPWTGEIFARKAAAMGVQVIPSGNFGTGGPERVEAVRICLGPPADTKEVARGAAILASILEESVPQAAPFM